MNMYASDEIKITSEINIDEVISRFCHRHGIQRIVAFVGGSDDTPNKIILSAIKRLKDYPVATLTGGTKWGVPDIVVTFAKNNGLKTIGVYPEVGQRHAHGPEHLDLSLCVPPACKESVWGDESEVLAKLVDGVIVCGGSLGTLVEISHLLKMNEGILKKDGLPKYIVPVTGTGGVADFLPLFCRAIYINMRAFPLVPITNGNRAAAFLIERLGLDHHRRSEVRKLFVHDHSHTFSHHGHEGGQMLQGVETLPAYP